MRKEVLGEINQLILVGRLTRNPELQKIEGKNNCHISIAVRRNYKNSDGIYETDYISCTVWNVIAEKVCTYCKKGDIVSIKARVQNNNYVDKDDKKIYTYEIIAEQVAFMQSQNREKSEELLNALG